jgi:hypothetical protein
MVFLLHLDSWDMREWEKPAHPSKLKKKCKYETPYCLQLPTQIWNPQCTSLTPFYILPIVPRDVKWFDCLTREKIKVVLLPDGKLPDRNNRSAKKLC